MGLRHRKRPRIPWGSLAGLALLAAAASGCGSGPAAAPGGSLISTEGRIAFTRVSEDAEAGDIYVMDADGSGLTRLTDNAAEDSFPAWRP